MDIASVLISAGALLLWVFWVRRGVQQSREEDLATAEGAEQLVAEIQQLQQQMSDAVARDDYPEAINISEQMLILSDNHFGDDPDVILPLLIALSNFHQIANQPDKAIPYLQRCLSLYEKFPQPPADQASTLGELSALHLQAGASREAMPLIRREVEFRRRHLPADEALLRAQCNLLSLNLKEPAMAEPLRRDITITAKQLNPELILDLTSEANSDLRTALSDGRLNDAWSAAEKATLLSIVAHGPEHELTYVCRGNLAEMLRRNRRFEDAEIHFQQLISDEEKRENGTEGLRAAFNNLALLYDECGRAEDAAKLRERQMEMLQGHEVSIGSRFNALNNLAVSQSNKGDNETAARTYAEALTLSPDGDEVSPDVWADTLNNYGITLVNLQRLVEAGRIYKKVLDRKKAGMDVPMSTIASSFNGLGIVSEQLGKLQQAQDMFERALAIKEKYIPADHLSLETARHNLGSIYAQRGDVVHAAQMAQLVLSSREKRLGKDHPETQSAQQNLTMVTATPRTAIASTASATRADVETLMVNITGGQLFHYATYDFGRARDTRVSMVLIPEAEAITFHRKLTLSLPTGWQCFIGSTRWLGEEKYDGMAELVAIQATSQFDCLRVARTNAVNHDLDTEDIIRTLEDYDQRFGIRIYSASTDTVGFMLLREPKDLDSFAQELLDFCMDLEDVELIKQMISASGNRVELWWD